MCHSQGMEAIPEYVIQQRYQLPDDKLKGAIYQLVDLYPILLIEKEDHTIIVDYCELVCRAHLVHNIITLDLKPQHESDASVSATQSGESEGIFFFKKSGPGFYEVKWVWCSHPPSFRNRNIMWGTTEIYQRACNSACRWLEFIFKNQDILLT